MRIRSVLAARVRIRVERIAAGAADAVLSIAPERRFCTLLEKRAPASTGAFPVDRIICRGYEAENEISARPDKR